ncbi:hypothetical protein PSTG_04964 [Puccinia striiformis f. sp. tritici PST-78]|uniref:Uncharacterized protein n=1 Tax=Puccinia striiformis f. sp. tritici PST-78 TaxID=1165861 RepID=A0A0L0VS57_9BASI|nr:hypothetical protein PSTG_04964 [Puccinia striiformis f. sp. tritici PST-78]
MPFLQQEPHLVPILTKDWGADEELLLIEACQIYGLGNWSDIADHMGNNRTKEEVEQHYLDVSIGSNDYPFPPIDARINIDPGEFQGRKKSRLEEVHARPLRQSIGWRKKITFLAQEITTSEKETEFLSKFPAVFLSRAFTAKASPENLPEEGDQAEQKDENDAAHNQDDEMTCEDSAKKQKCGVGSGAGKTTQRTDEHTTRNEAAQETDGKAIETNERDSMPLSSVDPLQIAASPKQNAKSKQKEKEEQKADK